ncbi:MAG: Rqc2 family fibronectin-binding protein [Chloroflexota bacterium]
MAAVVDDLAPLAGGQVQKIIQSSAASVALSVYANRCQTWIVLSSDPTYARVNLSSQPLAKAFATPSSFVMLLRKHIEGTRIARVQQVPTERILTIDCGPTDFRVQLVAEIMGKHSNIMLIDQNKKILGAVKMVPPRLSRVRPILPGHAYVPPPVRPRDDTFFPAGPRIDPIASPAQFSGLLHGASGATVSRALMGSLLACSPLLVQQIAVRAGLEPEQALAGTDIDSLSAAVNAVYGLFRSRQWQPCTFTNARGRPDFAAYLPVGMEHVQAAESMSSAIESCMSAGESRDALAVIRNELASEIQRAQQAIERRVNALQHGLESAGTAHEVMDRGRLMLAYQWAIEPNSDVLNIPELDAHIPLDPRLSGAENAEKTFRRYRKLRDAARKIPALVSAAEAERNRLNEVAVFIELAMDEGTLNDLKREVHPEREHRASTRKRRGPLRYRLNGALAIVGRNGTENEEVTFRLAGRDDLWLHARERTGAHVILRGTAGEPDMLRAAAALAAFHSEGRADTRVDVDVVSVRNVRKVPKGPPGRVTYRNAETVTVAPRLEGWSREG